MVVYAILMQNLMSIYLAAVTRSMLLTWKILLVNSWQDLLDGDIITGDADGIRKQVKYMFIAEGICWGM